MADELSMEVLEEIGIQNCDTVIVGIGEKDRYLHPYHSPCGESGSPQSDRQGYQQRSGSGSGKKVGAEVIYPRAGIWPCALQNGC